MSDTQKPSFFIIGAPKCGTTALSEYLRDHPDVYISTPKEPRHFSTDISDRFIHFRSNDEYVRHCFPGSAKYTAVGEASPGYLRSREAVPNILQFNPTARFIALIRDPASLFYSYFHEMRAALHEDLNSPEEAWRLRYKRRNGESIPSYCSDPTLIDYDDVCRLGEHLRRLYASVSADRVHIIFLEDLQSNPLQTYKDTLSFLGVEYDGKTTFPVINQRKRHRSRRIAEVLRVAGDIRKRITQKPLGIQSRLRRMNLERFSPPQLDPGLREELQRHFADDVHTLETLTGRDLGHWRND